MARELIKAWKAQRFAKPPYVLDADSHLIPSAQSVVIRSYEELIKRDIYGLADSKFHLGLMPVPFIGDVERADIYIGLINPGLDLGSDYYVESTRPDFCEVLLRNLRQQLGSDDYPFYPLDPKWHWTGAGSIDCLGRSLAA